MNPEVKYVTVAATYVPEGNLTSFVINYSLCVNPEVTYFTVAVPDIPEGKLTSLFVNQLQFVCVSRGKIFHGSSNMYQKENSGPC